MEEKGSKRKEDGAGNPSESKIDSGDKVKKKQKTRAAHNRRLRRARRLIEWKIDAEDLKLSAWAFKFLKDRINSKSDDEDSEKDQIRKLQLLHDCANIEYRLRIEEEYDVLNDVAMTLSYSSGRSTSYNDEYEISVQVACRFNEITDVLWAAVMLLHKSCDMDELQLFFGRTMSMKYLHQYGNCFQWWNDAMLNDVFKRRVSKIRMFRFFATLHVYSLSNRENSMETPQEGAPAMNLSMCNRLVNVALNNIGLTEYPNFPKFRHRCQVSVRSNWITDLSELVPRSTLKIDATFNRIRSLPLKLCQSPEIMCSCLDPTHRFTILLQGNHVFENFYEMDHASGKCVRKYEKICQTGTDYMEKELTEYIVSRGLLGIDYMEKDVSAYILSRGLLEFAIIRGLAAKKKGAWSVFLTVGLYDPRLFLTIWGFVTQLFYKE